MKKFTTGKNTIKFSAVLFVLAIIGIGILINACNKGANTSRENDVNDQKKVTKTLPLILNTPLEQNKPIVSVVTVASIGTNATNNVTRVLFYQNEEVFTVSDATVIATLKNAFNNNLAVQATFDPHSAIVSQASIASTEYQSYYTSKEVITTPGKTLRIDATTTDEMINHTADVGIINTTTPGLNGVIPDLATAQLMFDYISHQCCALPGPYAISYCIPFQYVPDGCYARASMMCWIINNDYHYATQKLFSFANAPKDHGTDTTELCVQANKWGGCCINWWYHVAPLVTINTSEGPKAYIMDPAMFDQPVPVATWLHFQANPTCADGNIPQVTMINIQPNASYQPATYNGLSFSTDPGMVEADAILVSYAHLISCP